MTALSLLLLTSAYLLGSIMGALITNKALGATDPRLMGSGNPGASNMLRSHGKAAGLLTLLIDIVKGIVPVLLAKALSQPDWIVALIGLFAFLGHIFPLYHHFKGGKGVATALGVIAVLNVELALALVGVWILIFALTKISGAASISTALSLPLFAYFLSSNHFFVFMLIALLIIGKHKDNIQRMVKGEEPQTKTPTEKESTRIKRKKRNQ